jgi:hypothetical protein
MADIKQIIEAAKAIEAALTLCQCWVDRVALAQSYFEGGETAKCQTMIDEANRYAI